MGAPESADDRQACIRTHKAKWFAIHEPHGIDLEGDPRFYVCRCGATYWKEQVSRVIEPGKLR